MFFWDTYLQFCLLYFSYRFYIARLNNSDFFDFEAQGGLVHLHDDVSRMGHDNPLTALRPKYESISFRVYN